MDKVVFEFVFEYKRVFKMLYTFWYLNAWINILLGNQGILIIVFPTGMKIFWILIKNKKKNSNEAKI